MDDDKTLLERAAKAAGFKLDKSPFNGGGFGNTGFDACGNAVLDWHNGKKWNALTDDGDCARMEAALSIDVYWSPGRVDCAGPFWRTHEDFADHNGDRNAARRRASVRAAAAMAGGEQEGK